MNQDRTWDDLCQLYLSGELSASQQQAFEDETFSSADRIAAFNHHANMLAVLGESRTGQQSAATTHAQSWSVTKIAITATALAASMLLILSLASQPSSENQLTAKQNFEQTKPDIAEVWAATHESLDLADFEIDNSLIDPISQVQLDEELPSWLALGVAEAAMLDESGDEIDG